jgi:uncharacterized protein (TIGR02145 family)
MVLERRIFALAFLFLGCTQFERDNIYDQEAENFVAGCTESPVPANHLCDARSGLYRYVQINNLLWMAENLNYKTSGSKCYENKPENCAKYGRLYTWTAAAKACPAGWRLPSDLEWEALVDFAGGSYMAGAKLKATWGWNWDISGDTTGNGSDEFGFSALPGGYGSPDGNSFYYAGVYGYWWSGTEYAYYDAYAYYLTMEYNSYSTSESDNTKEYMYSVRCVK